MIYFDYSDRSAIFVKNLQNVSLNRLNYEYKID